MKIPDELEPKRLAALLGISVGQLAVEMNVSYHLLHGWSRRHSAPEHAVRFLKTEAARLIEKKRAEIAAIEDPVDRAVAISQVPLLAAAIASAAQEQAQQKQPTKGRS